MNTSLAAIVPVQLAERSYSIRVGAGLLDSASSYDELPRGSSAVIVSNDTVGALYAKRLTAALQAFYPRITVLHLPEGEAFKTWSTLQLIFDGLLAAHCDRSTTVFALGGGVIGDLAGFAAACYMRGIDYVQVPTTLLAQVDSSIGGKTGINHPAGKNMIGAFHQPARVVIDVETLASLPRRELVAGLAEVIKYGAIADHEFLDWIDQHLSRLLSCDEPALVHAIKRSCEIKAAIVAADERETGVRATLNFGHTFAHAIEAGLGYGAWLHGEAVGCGMVMAADLSVRLGLVDRSHAERITAIVARAGLPVRAPALGTARFLELMRVDKKADAGEMRFILLEGPGRAVLRPVRPEWVSQTIQALSQAA